MIYRRRSIQLDDAKMNLTPMIDVTFLLLIFFLLATRFRKDEGLLQAHLPKQGHQMSPKTPIDLEDIRVKMVPGRAGTELRVGDRKVAFNPKSDPHAVQLRKVLKRYSGLSDTICIIDAHNRVPSSDVVAAFNAAVATGFSEISFTLPDSIKEQIRRK